MRITCFTAFFTAGFLLTVILSLPAQDSVLMEFSLQDQFDRVHSRQDFQNKIVVLIGSDREGSQYNTAWIKPMVDSLKNEAHFEEIAFVGVADLRGIPFFLKGYVKGKFSKEYDRWVLLDWDGEFARNYDFEAEACNLRLFNPDGQLEFEAACRKPEQEKLHRILSSIRGMRARFFDK